jgi:hypothetical protein
MFILSSGKSGFFHAVVRRMSSEKNKWEKGTDMEGWRELMM